MVWVLTEVTLKVQFFLGWSFSMFLWKVRLRSSRVQGGNQQKRNQSDCNLVQFERIYQYSSCTHVAPSMQSSLSLSSLCWVVPLACLCLSNRAGVFLFALLATADETLPSAGNGAFLVRIKLKEVVFEERCTWGMYAYVKGTTSLSPSSWCLFR